MGALSVAQHVERAQRHRKVGDALAAAGPDAMTKAWESVGRSLRTAMNAEKQARRSR